MRWMMWGVIALALAVLAASACNPYEAGWRTLDGVQKARHLVGDEIGRAAKAKLDACIKQHGAGTPASVKCAAPAAKMVRSWHLARSVVVASEHATATGLTIAAQVKAKGYKWLDSLRPALCGVVRIVELFRAEMGQTAGQVVGMLAGLAAGVCQ